MTIAATSFNSAAADLGCPAYPGCFFTDEWLDAAFTPAHTRTDDAWFFHYIATDQSLIFHEWKNAACNRGGNHGDIQSVSTGLTPPPTACTP